MYRLLIIEDEPLIRKGIRTLIDFEALGISECIEAKDGYEGQALFTAHAPHLVLLDINLPGMNGIELAKQFKASDPNVRIAIITGYDYFDYAVSALKIGVDDYILKPVGKSDIAAILFRLVEKIEKEQVSAEVTRTVGQLMKSAQTPLMNPNSYAEPIRRILDAEVFSSSFSLMEMANRLNLNPNYLSTVFKSIYGIPFQDYVLNQRLEKSKLMLLTSTLKIYEIAEQVGFDDVNYFSTRFKKAYGVSPKQFLQNVRTTHGKE